VVLPWRQCEESNHHSQWGEGGEQKRYLGDSVRRAATTVDVDAVVGVRCRLEKSVRALQPHLSQVHQNVRVSSQIDG
jgi:hypothetical protein